MTLLNQATKIMHGTAQASAVYAGATKVWPAFKPTDLSGCAVWLDASKLALANGAAVTSWTNLGSGSQPTIAGSPSPTFRTNALNTIMPVVRVTSGQGRFRFTGTGVDKDWTLFYVGRKWRMTTGRVVAANASSSGTPNILVGFHGNEWDQCYVEGWLTPQNTTQATSWKLYSADSTSTAVARFFSNGVLLYSGAATPAKGWGGTLCMPGWDDGATQEADAEFAELVMYNRKLTDTERQSVEKYLREKWSAPTRFTPTDLGANLNGWFDAADASSVQRSGTGVSNWVNKSGYALALTQSTDAYKPSCGGDIMNITTPQAFVANWPEFAFDVVFVGRPQHVSRGDWRTLLRTPVSAPVGAHHIIVEAGSTKLGCYNAGFFQAGALTWDNVWGICYGRFSEAAAASLSRDGGAMTSMGTTIALASLAFVGFGAWQGPPPSQGWGDIKEIIFLPYNSEGLRPIVEGYLAHRHGLAGLLPGGHLYKNAPP